MSLIDSVAAFKNRCNEICGDLDLHEKLKTLNIRTFSDLAFSCGTPRSEPSEEEMRQFGERVAGAGISMGESAKLRRLHFEASTYVRAQLRTAVSSDSSDRSRKLPLAEKSARLEEQRKRLAGLEISDEMTPSHALIDLVTTMTEANCLQWIAPSKCTKRDQELRLLAKDKSKSLSVLEGSVVLAPMPDKITADHSTPLQLQWCLQRRGLALDLMQVVSWKTHERWLNFLLQSLATKAPAGYEPVSIQQLLKADSEIFLLASKEVSQVRPEAGGHMQVDEAILRLKTDARITMHLLPLPRGMASAAKVEGSLQIPQGFDRPAKRRRTAAKKGTPPKTDTMPNNAPITQPMTDADCVGVSVAMVAAF